MWRNIYINTASSQINACYNEFICELAVFMSKNLHLFQIKSNLEKIYINTATSQTNACYNEFICELAVLMSKNLHLFQIKSNLEKYLHKYSQFTKKIFVITDI
jgi:hypothetical protein